MRSVDECASCIARQIARGKRAATADTRVLAPAHPSQVHTRDRLQMERANGYSGVTWCKWSAPMWYGGAHGGFYETLTSLVYFALLATPLPVTDPGAHASCLSLCPPCSLPAANLCSPRLPHTLSFPDAVVSILCRSYCRSAAHRQNLPSAHSSAVLPIGTRRSDCDSSICACVRVQI